MTDRTSVLLTALGAEAARLHPEVLEYAAGPPDRCGYGLGRGVFEVAGSRFGRLARLARPFTGPGLLVTRYERDVPFTVVNRVALAVDGAPALAAERNFGFRDGSQRFTDALLSGPEAGTLRNILGARGRVELIVECTVTDHGRLRLRSRAALLRIGRLRVRLPALLGVAVEVEHGFDEAVGLQTIAVRARNPILGTVLEYRGRFGYEYREQERSGPALPERQSGPDPRSILRS